MMNKQLSIITINYNNADGLKKTMNSVINQSFTEFEYIIIDGNSTDSSIEIIKSYNFDNLSWICENDTGIYNAMNKGIKKANGKYLLFLNSGDILNGNNALLDFISNVDFSGDIIYGDYQFLKGEKIYPDLLTPLHFFKSSLPHQSSFIKKKLFELYGNYDENFEIVSDKLFYIKCFLSGKVKFKHLNQKLSIVDLNGISNNFFYKDKVENENKIILKKYFGVFYTDYINYINLVQKYNGLKRKTLKGILIRIKKKINNYSEK